MSPVGKSKNYTRYYEFRQIICPLNKHRQNKQKFGKISKIQFNVLKLISTTMVVLVTVVLKFKTKIIE